MQVGISYIPSTQSTHTVYDPQSHSLKTGNSFWQHTCAQQPSTQRWHVGWFCEGSEFKLNLTCNNSKATAPFG